MLHASTFVRMCACICAQKIKRPDVSRRNRSLRPDTSFVQGLLGCTISSRSLRASLDNLYIPTSSLAMSFSSVTRVQTIIFYTERLQARPQPAAFLSQCICITPTYVYASFISDMILTRFTVPGKTSRQTLPFDCFLYWSHIAWVSCHQYETESLLRTNQVHHFRPGM